MCIRIYNKLLDIRRAHLRGVFYLSVRPFKVFGNELAFIWNFIVLTRKRLTIFFRR